MSLATTSSDSFAAQLLHERRALERAARNCVQRALRKIHRGTCALAQHAAQGAVQREAIKTRDFAEFANMDMQESNDREFHAVCLDVCGHFNMNACLDAVIAMYHSLNTWFAAQTQQNSIPRGAHRHV